MTTYNFTTFDAAIQAKLNTASVSLNAQDYLLLAKAVQTAIETSNGVSLLDLKGTPNGLAGLDSNAQVLSSQLLNALPSQSLNSGKILTTNGSLASWTNTATLSTISTTGDATIGNNIFVGPGAGTFHSSLTDASAAFVVSGGINSYGQLAFKNTEPTSSTDIIAYSAEGTDLAGWIDMGITGATFNSATYGITGPHDGYIFMQAVSGTDGAGNLVIATGDNGTQNKIVFAAGGYASGNTQMSITPNVNVHIEIPTPSTSPSTGALTVVGGVGISGDLNIQGDVDIQGTITFGGAGTTVETANLSVTDPLVFVGASNAADIVDLGLVGEYKTGGVTKFAGIVRDASDGVIKTFKDASTKPTSTVNFSEIGLAYADLQVASLTASSINVAGISNIEFGYLDGVTSAIQTQINSKSNSADPTFTGTVVLPSATSIGNVSSTEIGYLDGITSAVQTQLDAKLSLSTAASTYAPLLQTPDSTKVFSGNNYTLVSGDKDKILLLSNGSTSGTVTVPSGVFSVGTVLTIVQSGSGQLTLTQSGTTLNSSENKLKLNGLHASCQLICTAANTFLVIGNLAA